MCATMPGILLFLVISMCVTMYRTHMRRHPLRLEEDAGLPGTELLSMGFGNLSGGSLEEQQQVLLTLQSAILPAPLLSLSPVARG